MNDRQQNLAKLYEMRGWRPPDPNTIREEIYPYIEQFILKPLRNRPNSVIAQEAETISLQVAGKAYTAGHEKGWNDALTFLNTLTDEFATNEQSTVETFEDSAGNRHVIIK